MTVHADAHSHLNDTSSRTTRHAHILVYLCSFAICACRLTAPSDNTTDFVKRWDILKEKDAEYKARESARQLERASKAGAKAALQLAKGSRVADSLLSYFLDALDSAALVTPGDTDQLGSLFDALSQV